MAQVPVPNGVPPAAPPAAAAPAGPGSPTIDETTGEPWKPSFWQHPFVQNALPFITSMVFHVSILVLGYLLLIGVTKATTLLHKEANVDTQSVLADQQEGGVPHPGLNGAEADAAQDNDKDVPPDSQGISDHKSDSTAMSLAGGGTGDESNDGVIAIGSKSGGYSAGHGNGFGHGDSAGGGNGEDGAEAPFGIPNTGHDGLLPKSSFLGLGGNARHIVYVCDATGSMMDKFDALRGEIQKSVRTLKATQSYSIVFFQEHNDDHSDDLVAMSKELQLAWPETNKKAFDFLDKVTPRGGTDPVPALKAGMAMHPDILYFLVDPGDFPDKPGVLALMKQLNADHKTKIMTIAFLDHDPEDEKFLKELANENGGQFRDVEEKDLDAEN